MPLSVEVILFGVPAHFGGFPGWMQIGHPAIAEVFANAGYEWIAVDCEHTDIGIKIFTDIARGIYGRDSILMARVRENNILAIRQVLDAGAQGVIVPLVNSAEEAKRAVAVAKYPPEGIRGFAFCRVNNWSVNFDRYAKTANDNVAVVVMIESRQVVENIDGILAVDGVDGVFIGPYDMSGSYGITGQTSHPIIKEACKVVLEACKVYGKSAGLHVVMPTDESIRQAIEDGFTFIALGIDGVFLDKSARTVMRAAKEAMEYFINAQKGGFIMKGSEKEKLLKACEEDGCLGDMNNGDKNVFAAGAIPDWRHISNGREIPTELYSDQPYIIKTDDGAWLCILTTGTGHEGQTGQHVISMRSTDCGMTWTDIADVEAPDGPEASYAVLLKVPGGRIYCFYNHNTDNIRKIKADNPPYTDGYCRRVDSMGYFVFKYSDDHGRSWSDKRYNVSVREMEIDRNNVYGGKIRFFWNVGKSFVHDGAAFVSLHKVGGIGEGFFTRSEGVLLKSVNIITENNPEKLVWETLPDGETGLRTPPGGGPVSEEQSYSVLDDGSFYCVYRSTDGHPVYSYSRDGGHTWTEPGYKRYADGRLMKHPRAANFVWKCSNGKYLYWFHNHGGKDYEDRNPVWISGGVERDSPDGRIIKWSQPEILLYNDDTFIRMSYPDLIEENGNYYISETQKDIARIHKIDNEFLLKLWGQFDNRTVSKDGLVLNLTDSGEGIPAEKAMPLLPAFLERDLSRADYGTRDLRKGFTIDMWVMLKSLHGGQILLDSRNKNGQGLALLTANNGTVELVLNDGRTENRWNCDQEMLVEDKLHHIAVVVDGGTKTIMFITDGKFNDGGELRQFGWGRFSRDLRHANGSSILKVGGGEKVRLKLLRIYQRALMISEVIGNYKAGL